jgi:iron complex outermembrane receptor protein
MECELRNLRTASWHAALIVLSAGQVAKAQETAAPSEPAQQLPPVLVETTKPKAPVAAKKKKAKSQGQAVVSPVPQSQQQGTQNTSRGETGIGPVNGYVATQTTSGTKTDTPIVEIPRSLDVITADQIRNLQPKSIRDAVGYTPGVQIQQGAGSILDNISVRGFSAPIYLNGLLLPTDTAIGFSRMRLEPYGLERLEILKGPPSGLFGQSPPGGIINAISKRPQFSPQNEAYVQYGTNDHKEAGFDFTGPVDSSGALAYRMVGVVRDTDLDFDLADRQRYFLAPSLTWRPTEDTTITFLGTLQRDSGFGPFQFVDMALTRPHNGLPRVSRDTYFGEPSVDDYQEDQWSVGYSLEHRFNDALRFRQNLRYSDSSQDLVAMRAIGLDPDGPLDPFYQSDGRTVWRGVNALDLESKGFAIDNQLEARMDWGATRHRVLAGVDYQHQSSSSGFWVANPPTSTNPAAPFIPPIDAYDPQYGQAPIVDPFVVGGNFVLADSTLDQLGVYLQDQIKFGDGWIATLGGRQDFAKTKLHDLRAAATTPHQEVEDEAFTGFAGLSYDFGNGVVPYINYSTSFLPAAGSSLINASTGLPLKPTTGEGYEAGVKYQPLGTKTLLTAAIFQITQQNITTVDPATRATTQTGEVRVRGYELEGKTSITDNFDLIAGYSYIEPIITADANGANVGNDFQQLSRHTASIWGMYHWHEGPLAGLGLGMGLRYVGSQWAEAANANKLPAYTLVDAAATFDLKYLSPGLDGTVLQINGYNLTDEYYLATCQGATFCQFGESRSILATIKYDW